MKNFKKVTELIKKTGDRYIFEDEDGNLFVVMEASDYERFILRNSQVQNLSEEELLNKINKDIAIWKESQADKKIMEDWQPLKPEKNEDLLDDEYYFEPVEDED